MKKKYLIVGVLILVEIASIFLMYKSNTITKELDNVSIKKNTDNNMIAMYVGIGDTYEEYKGNTFPKGYTLNKTKSKCLDIDGQEVSNVLSQVDGQIKVASNKTVYCYIYLDIQGKQCTYSGNLTQGATYTNGPYTYKYKQRGNGKTEWKDIDDDGWGVMLTDKESTTPVTGELCTTINNKPIVSSSYMFYQSKASSIDVSSFNTSLVKDMYAMFAYSSATTISGYENFDTSSVTNIGLMFEATKIPIIDVSNYNTSNVTDAIRMFSDTVATQIIGYEDLDLSSNKSIYGMFSKTNIPSIDISNYAKYSKNFTNMGQLFWLAAATEIKGYENFDTSNVTEMSSMFNGTKVSTIDVREFNTSKVTSMSYMFTGSAATQILGYEDWDTSGLKSMTSMFSFSNVATIDISKWDTSNITSMAYLFQNSKAKTIKLGNIDTRKVKKMNNMFEKSEAITISGLENLETSLVDDMMEMFFDSAAVELDLSSFDTSNVTNMWGMFCNSKATSIKGLTRFNTANVTTMVHMFRNTLVKELDLSSFDTTNVTSMTDMFKDAAATTGYARTSTDANKFNTSSGKPSGLTFTVKN